MRHDASGRSSLGVLVVTGVLFAVSFLVLMTLLDVAFGEGLVSAFRSNIDNAIVVATIWTIAMWFLRRRRLA